LSWVIMAPDWFILISVFFGNFLIGRIWFSPSEFQKSIFTQWLSTESLLELSSPKSGCGHCAVLSKTQNGIAKVRNNSQCVSYVGIEGTYWRLCNRLWVQSMWYKIWIGGLWMMSQFHWPIKLIFFSHWEFVIHFINNYCYW